MPQFTWLITGRTSGIGKNLVHAVIARGDRVIATTHNGSERLQYAEDAGAVTLDRYVTAAQVKLDGKVQTSHRHLWLSRCSCGQCRICRSLRYRGS